ncbi:MAG TPA: hypothetical protein VK550_20470 [Polyangiaceae bacterium]|nr:hypothetical protein [Polyangiaceae bacterium]
MINEDFSKLHNDKKKQRAEKEQGAAPPPKPPVRNVSLNGQFHNINGVGLGDKDIAYCGSRKTFDEACRLKAELDEERFEPANTVILIYRMTQIPRQTLFVRTDVINGGERPEGKVAAYSLFLVLKNLATDEKKVRNLAKAIEDFLKKYGQTGDPSYGRP